MKEENTDFHSKPIEEKNWPEDEGQLVIDAYRENDNFVIRSPIAGIKTEEVSITFENDMIIIKGERKRPESDDNKSYFIRECYWGNFSREMVLPVEVDEQRTKAKIENGILKIVMPIIEKRKTKKVDIEK